MSLKVIGGPVFGMALSPSQEERFRDIMPPETKTNAQLLQDVFVSPNAEARPMEAGSELLARLDGYPAEKRPVYARHFIQRLRDQLRERHEREAAFRAHHPVRAAGKSLARALGLNRQPEPNTSVVEYLLKTARNTPYMLEDPTASSLDRRVNDLHYEGPLFNRELEAQYLATVIENLPPGQSHFLAEVVAHHAGDARSAPIVEAASARLREMIARTDVKTTYYREQPAVIAFQALQVFRGRGVQPDEGLLGALIEKAFPKEGKPGSDSMVSWSRSKQPVFDAVWEKRYLNAAIPHMKGSGSLLDLVLVYPKGHEVHEQARKRIRELVASDRGAVFSFVWDLKRRPEAIPQDLFDELMDEAALRRPRKW